MLTVGQDTAGGVGGSGVCGVVGALALALASADWYWCPRHSWALPRTVSSSWTGGANLAPTTTTTAQHTPCTVHCIL